MTNIAMFTTYAPSEGFGGPARAFHQRRVLEDAGHSVTHIVIQAAADRGDCRRTDLVELCERPHREPVDHIYADVDLGRRAAADVALVERVVEHLRSSGCDLIILEQPFLVRIARIAVDRLRIPVIYSCQNIEYRLRRDLERFQLDANRPVDRSEGARRLEAEAVELASHVTAICPTDQELLREEFGCESTLVPNGTSVSEIPLPPRRSGDDPYFAFAGSSYWPNVEGFAQMATPSLAFLPPTVKIHVAGTVGTEILRDRSILRHQSANASRILLRGFLGMEDLVAMMHRSTAVLVPVFIGEGSNLKSADALASGAPVIMTERATRGYERVIEDDPEGVTVVTTASDFREGLMNRLRLDERPFLGEKRRSRLTWSRRLDPLLDLVANATPAPPPA